jgi:CBS domain containing-hemolysin-like protein
VAVGFGLGVSVSVACDEAVPFVESSNLAISEGSMAVVFLVLLNGFFVASEFAIVKVRSSQLDALAARGNGHARLARHVTSHLDAYLSATQLGITLASLGLGWLGEPFLARMIEPFFALANITSPAVVALDLCD